MSAEPWKDAPVENVVENVVALEEHRKAKTRQGRIERAREISRRVLELTEDPAAEKLAYHVALWFEIRGGEYSENVAATRKATTLGRDSYHRARNTLIELGLIEVRNVRRLGVNGGSVNYWSIADASKIFDMVRIPVRTPVSTPVSTPELEVHNKNAHAIKTKEDFKTEDLKDYTVSYQEHPTSFLHSAKTPVETEKTHVEVLMSSGDDSKTDVNSTPLPPASAAPPSPRSLLADPAEVEGWFLESPVAPRIPQTELVEFTAKVKPRTTTVVREVFEAFDRELRSGRVRGRGRGAVRYFLTMLASAPVADVDAMAERARVERSGLHADIEAMVDDWGADRVFAEYISRIGRVPEGSKAIKRLLWDAHFERDDTAAPRVSAALGITLDDVAEKAALFARQVALQRGES